MHSGLDTTPNSGLTPMVRVDPMANLSLVPSQSPNVGDTIEKFKRDLDRLFYKKYGIETKDKVYQKPYPDYFDALPYPPGYWVPDFVKFNGVDNKTT